MNERAPLLELTDIRSGFGSHRVLHGVSFRVYEGEVAAVLGLNGAGKSVTMKVIGGVVPAWSGSLMFDGHDITNLDAEARVARGLAHVPQGRQVFPDLTVEQNLRLGAYTLRRRAMPRYRGVLDGVLDRFPRLRERLHQPAGTLSGGEQAMLAVGRALMSEPRLVLVDEASAGLAPIAVKELFATLREVNRSGVTILMVEQNVTFSLGVADRAHIMQQGRIVYDGDVESLDQDKVAQLLGIGRLFGKHVTAAADARRAPAFEPGTDVVANGTAKSTRKKTAKPAARKTTAKTTPRKTTAKTTPRKTAAKAASQTTRRAAPAKRAAAPRRKAR